MQFFKLPLVRIFSIVLGVVVAFGLGIFVMGLQQPQKIQVQASTSPNNAECNTQYGNASNPRCCSVTYAGGMCKYDNDGTACAGGFITTTSSYTTWYCPLGNNYRCCMDATPSTGAVTATPAVITLPTDHVTLTGQASDADQDSRNLKTRTWSKVSGPGDVTFANASADTTEVSGLQPGTYVFNFEVSDGYQKADKTVSVTVNGPAPTATSTPAPLSTKLALDLLLHGIGKAGDSVLPGAAGGGNMDPKHPKRDVTVVIKNLQNQVLLTKKGKVVFASSSGSFKTEPGAEIDLGPSFTTGAYFVTVKLSQSLETQIAGAPLITANTVTALPQTSLVTGDINNDGSVENTLYDYNVFLGCYSTILPPVSCTDEQKVQADLDDNKVVDDFDFNLFIRELTFRTQ